MFGYDTFGTSIFHGETFSVETEILPCLEDIFLNGHTLFKERSFAGGQANLTFPTSNTMLIEGNVAGKSIRFIPADGYEIHWDSGDEAGDLAWEGGLGKHFNDNDEVPVTYTAHKMVEKSTGKEYTFGPCPTNGGSNGGSDPFNGGSSVYGCMVTNATNYDETATEDNGSCLCEEGFELNTDTTECVEESEGLSDLIKYGLYAGVGLTALLLIARRR